MRALVLFSLVLVASVSAFVEVETNYHDAIGIPTFEKILATETEILEKQAQGERIVGGALAPALAHPYFAGLQIRLIGIATNSVCGSSLLSSTRLVTAAHCWLHGQRQAWEFVVILGSNYFSLGGIRIATSHVIMHPQYIQSTLANDVAMIYLPTPVQFSESIQPISLPNIAELWDTFEGRWAVAAGFGRTSDLQLGASNVVSHVGLQVISEQACRDVFGGVFVLSSTLCTSGAGGVGICGGDSGGPLVLFNNGRTTLIGISSFVASNGCQLNHPSAFARVTSFHTFINQHLWN